MNGSGLRGISDGLDRLVVWACVALVLVMLTISTLGIFFEVIFAIAERFGFAEAFVDSPLDWAFSHTRPSLTRLFLPWVAMLSLTVAFKRGEHIAITLAVRNLPAAALLAVRIVNLAVVGLFGVALLWYGHGFFVNSTQIFMVSDLVQVSHKWTAASVPGQVGIQ